MQVDSMNQTEEVCNMQGGEMFCFATLVDKDKGTV